MIATGDCSYENYCKFIHDRRLKCYCRIVHPTVYDRKEMNRRQKNQNATEKGFVVFYWPPMHVEGHQGHYVDRKYHLPIHPGPGGHKDYSYACMVSMWEHFIVYLHQNASHNNTADVDVFGNLNPFTNRPRLPVFRDLSLSETKRSVSQQSIPSASSEHMLFPHHYQHRSPARSPLPFESVIASQSPTPVPAVTSSASSSVHHAANVNLSYAELELKKLMDEVDRDHDHRKNDDKDNDGAADDRSVVTTSSDRSLEEVGEPEDLPVVKHSNGTDKQRLNGRHSKSKISRVPRT